MKIKVDLYSLETNIFLGTCLSTEILDSTSKNHGSLDLLDASPLRGCANGGRKIILIAEFPLAKDVQPQFQLFDVNGNRLEQEEVEFLNQPDTDKNSGTNVTREKITFVTPRQPFAERFLWNQWSVKLVAFRKSDALSSTTKFDFDIVPHDFYSTCFL